MARLTGRRRRRDRASAPLMLHETNPMLGHRGCRLGITYPEIYEMQARAIFEAAAAVKEETGETVEPEIMVPLIATKTEFDILKAMIDRVGRRGHGKSTRHRAPLSRRHDDRAAARRAAAPARSPRRRVLQLRHQRSDPDRSLASVARRRRRASSAPISGWGSSRTTRSSPSMSTGSASWCASPPSAAARTRPGLKLGICGEHGGDPASIRFCAKVGLDYVSCSPYRVPIARLAAAQAALSETGAAAHATD